MLVLTRKAGEAINIGSDIRIIVLGQSGNNIRLGVEAPKHVAVHRDDIKHVKREGGAA